MAKKNKEIIDNSDKKQEKLKTKKTNKLIIDEQDNNDFNESENKNVKKTKTLNEVLTSKLDVNEDDDIKINENYFKKDELKLPEPKPVDKIKPKKAITTNLSLNVKVYNKYVDYLPSDFSKKLIKKLFISNKSNFPKGTKISLELQPNDTERNLKVIVSIDKYYKHGDLINEQMIFKPFWIIGFKTYALLVNNERPLETLYRINNIHDFSYQEAQKLIRKKISSKKHDPKKSSFENENDFLRVRELKNWYIQQYVSKLNKMPNLTWECVPEIRVKFSKRLLTINLYIQIDEIKNDMKHSKKVYADSFDVKLNDLLDFTKNNNKMKIIDIDTIIYLVALNACYKNVKVFYYDTLYTVYKLLCAQLLSKGYKLKDISPDNLANLKIIDFSKHFFCKQKMFNDRILHIMNLVSSNEEYYRMKYAYTVQKNPSLLYSEFIVSEFKTNAVNELSTIIKNLENDYWEEKIKNLGRISNSNVNADKQFYINNYNVLDVTNNNYKSVEDFLMGTIKENKDEISRIAKLGEEILRVDDKAHFSNKEIKDLKKASHKLDENYKEIFDNSKKHKKTKNDKLYL